MSIAPNRHRSHAPDTRAAVVPVPVVHGAATAASPLGVAQAACGAPTRAPPEYSPRASPLRHAKARTPRQLPGRSIRGRLTPRAGIAVDVTYGRRARGGDPGAGDRAPSRSSEATQTPGGGGAGLGSLPSGPQPGSSYVAASCVVSGPAASAFAPTPCNGAWERSASPPPPGAATTSAASASASSTVQRCIIRGAAAEISRRFCPRERGRSSGTANFAGHSQIGFVDISVAPLWSVRVTRRASPRTVRAPMSLTPQPGWCQHPSPRFSGSGTGSRRARAGGPRRWVAAPAPRRCRPRAWRRPSR